MNLPLEVIYFYVVKRKKLNTSYSTYNRRARNAAKKFVSVTDIDTPNRLSAVPYKEDPNSLVAFHYFC